MIDDLDVTTLIKKRRRSKVMRLRVESDGSVVLTVPWRVSLRKAEQFLFEKKEWILAAYRRVIAQPPHLLRQGGKEEYVAKKKAARERIVTRVEYFCALYGTTYHTLSIRNQKSRFGSCSAKKHLSFNYRLLFLPETLFDYVVAHEVCHLRELNHSRKFWALVAMTIPDYQTRKRELQAFSRSIS